MLNMVESRTLKIKSDKMPPDIDFIEEEIIKAGLEPLRWAIVDVKDDILTLSVSGRVLQ